MYRSSKLVTQPTCHELAVIWAGTTKRRPKIFLRWWLEQGSLEVNIGLRVVSDVYILFNFVSIEGCISARMRGVQGL